MRKFSICFAMAACALALVSGVAAQPLGGIVAFPRGDVEENFGERVAPYGGFLVLRKADWPAGYVEKSHHYTKVEYQLRLVKVIDGKSYAIDIDESDHSAFFGPKNYTAMKSFTYKGVSGQVHLFPDHLQGRPQIDLMWMNPPKQRIMISSDQVPSQEWSPDDMIHLLQKMTLAVGAPPLVRH
jgi:hypothetical protein